LFPPPDFDFNQREDRCNDQRSANGLSRLKLLKRGKVRDMYDLANTS